MSSKYVYSSRQRWRIGSVSPCFSWPSNEETKFTDLYTGLGETVISETKMPNWRARIARGLNATTPYIARETVLEYSPGFLYSGKWCGGSVQNWGFYQYSGDLSQGHSSVWNKPPAAPTLIDAKTQNEALTRAIQDARSKQTHFRGGNFLAELTDTIRGLRNPVKGFRDLLGTYHRTARRRVKNAVGRRAIPTTQNAFKELEKSNKKVARAAHRALSDSWLEANFGWSPLLSDAADAYQALRRLSAKVPLARFYGTSSNTEEPTYASAPRFHTGGTVTATVRTQLSYDVTFYGAVKVQVDEPLGSAIEEMGVRARDFLPAVWEAIPYSFLIDYFSNVGDVIEAVSFPRSDLAWVSRTFRNHSTRSTESVAIAETSSPVYPASNSEKVWSFQPFSVNWDLRYVERNVYYGTLVPSLRFEIPGSKNWRKWCNVAALAHLRTL